MPESTKAKIGVLGASGYTGAELVRLRACPTVEYEQVAALKRQGKTLEDTVAARPTAAYDAKWGNFVIGPALFTKLVYEGV